MTSGRMEFIGFVTASNKPKMDAYSHYYAELLGDAEGKQLCLKR
jgi:hypothetical protein